MSGYKRSGVEYTHVILHGICSRSLTLAKEQEEGRFQACLITNLFAFLTVEAFLNFLGEELIGVEKWGTNFARPLSPRGKAVFLADQIGYPVNWHERPFSSLGAMRKFRISVVHGAPDRVGSSEAFNPDDHELLETFLASRCTVEVAEQFFEDASTICEALYDAAGMCESRSPRELWLVSYKESGRGPSAGR